MRDLNKEYKKTMAAKDECFLPPLFFYSKDLWNKIAILISSQVDIIYSYVTQYSLKNWRDLGAIHAVWTNFCGLIAIAESLKTGRFIHISTNLSTFFEDKIAISAELSTQNVIGKSRNFVYIIHIFLELCNLILNRKAPENKYKIMPKNLLKKTKTA